MIDNISLVESQGVLSLAMHRQERKQTLLCLRTCRRQHLIMTDPESISYSFSSLPAGAIIFTSASPSGITPVGEGRDGASGNDF